MNETSVLLYINATNHSKCAKHIKHMSIKITRIIMMLASNEYAQ